LGQRRAGQFGVPLLALMLAMCLLPPVLARRRFAGALGRGQHRLKVTAFLCPCGDGWSGDDWRAFYDERAGIAEFDGGLPWDQAEVSAFV
jgi:hypothetical protein